MLKDKLSKIYDKVQGLEKLLSNPDIISNPQEYKKYSREHSSLLPFVQKYKQYSAILDELENLAELKNSKDHELQKMAIEENNKLTEKKERLESEIKIYLIPPDPNDGKNIIIEIRAGTGGEEAALFAGELFRMYSRYVEVKGWKLEIIDSNATGIGGFKEIIFTISGQNIWKHLKYERGTHRVQRVPETEASGRVHTSAVTVAVLPEAEEVEVEVKPEDLRIDTYRASGAGGQHVNKTDSAIRITHVPTGIVVACQEERSQIKNRAKAMRILRAKLLEEKILEQERSITTDRKKQIGSGDRSEKIRTYNFPQNRLTDHRINFSLYRLQEIMEGDLDELINKLISTDQEERLASSGE
ncbi:peptide chain release factor 1 [Elusimicrobiota bacterium]